MKKIHAKVSSFLKKPGIRRIGPAVIAFVVIGSVGYAGSTLRRASHAASPGTLYVAPVPDSVAPGTTIAIPIREASGTDPVNAVQLALTYDASKLEYVSITEGTTFPFVAATSTDTAGMIRIARGVNVGEPGVSGDQLVATVNFKVLAADGTAQVGFDAASTLIVRSTDQQNILTATQGATYVVGDGGTAQSSDPELSAEPSQDPVDQQPPANETTPTPGDEVVLPTPTAPAPLPTPTPNPSPTPAPSTSPSPAPSPSPTPTTPTPAPSTGSGSGDVPSFEQGSIVRVTIHVRTPYLVNLVEAGMTYDPKQLQFVGLVNSIDFPLPAGTVTDTPGNIRIVRGVGPQGPGKSGDHVVVVIKFKVVGSNGSTSIDFDKKHSSVSRGNAHANPISHTKGTKINLHKKNNNGGQGNGSSHGNSNNGGGNANTGGSNGNGSGSGSTNTTAPPSLSSVSPNSGFAAGGAVVTLTGARFVTGAKVSFGGTESTQVTVTSPTSITAKVPAHAVGKVTVQVTNLVGGSASLASSYTYRLNGDVNGDGHVNGLDYSLLTDHKDQNYPAADFNADGTVGAADLAMMLAAWTW